MGVHRARPRRGPGVQPPVRTPVRMDLDQSEDACLVRDALDLISGHYLCAAPVAILRDDSGGRLALDERDDGRRRLVGRAAATSRRVVDDIAVGPAGTAPNDAVCRAHRDEPRQADDPCAVAGAGGRTGEPVPSGYREGPQRGRRSVPGDKGRPPAPARWRRSWARRAVRTRRGPAPARPRPEGPTLRRAVGGGASRRAARMAPMPARHRDAGLD